jgi:O-antigen ligase
VSLTVQARARGRMPDRPARRLAFAAGRYDTVSYLTVYLVLLMLVPASLIFGPLGGVGTPATVLSLVLLVWYLSSWILGRIAPSGGGRAVRVAMIAFALATLASFIAGMTRDITGTEALSSDRSLITTVAWAGLIVLVSQSVTNYERLDALMRRAVILGSVVAAIGIFEFYSGINVTDLLRIPGLTNNIDYSTLLVRGAFNRPSSTAVDPIEFGVVMAMLLPFAIQQAFNPLRQGNARKWLPVLLILLAIPVSVSRSGIVGLAVALLFFVPTWRPQQKGGFLIACLLGPVLIKVIAPGLLGTLTGYFTGMFGSSGQGTAASRTNDYALDWPYIVQRPIFGRGIGTFLPDTYSWTDNQYLHSLIETGIVGTAAMLVLFLAGIYCARAGRRRTQDETRRNFGQAIVAALVVVIVSSATFDSLSFPMFAGLTFLLLGAAGAYQVIMTSESMLPADVRMLDANAAGRM